MSVAPLPGYAYRLKNKGTGQYLTSADFSPTSYATVYPLESGGNGLLSQTWHLLGLDNDRYIIQQKLGGLVLTNDNYWPGSLPSFFGGVRLNLGGVDRNADQNVINSQTFVLRPSGSGYYTIVSHNGGGYASAAPNGSVRLYASPIDGDRHLWSLEFESSYPAVTGAQIGPTTNFLTDPPQATSFSRPSPETTTEVLIGATLLPSVLVNDPLFENDRRLQASESPWYIVCRFGFYRLKYFFNNSGVSAVTETQEVKVGVSTNNATEVERTTSISVTAEASYGFKGFSASLSTTYTNQLRTKVSQSTTETTEKTVSVRREFGRGYESALSIWYPSDRYALQRLDGTTVVQWETIAGDGAIERAYAPGMPRPS
ncbi:hypothetical protein [Streptomyces sp. A0592]|uniref:hypothetical protein n=1 Tax=Streptomyces sp. A0592 TaxID=2563099 RepID=UPI00109E63B7|nr:hypothetical protein [Streptomyces sp. A0592]THA77821.1 hypothetical protein E6U81_34205 [Streptomyces sp. A0592]